MARQKTTYFSHDSNARNDMKVLSLRIRHGAAGYGVFFMILERLRNENEYKSLKDYNNLAFEFRVDASLVKSVVEDFGLFVFTEDGKYFYSESFCNRMCQMDEIKAKRSKAAAQRWKRNDAEVNNKADEEEAKTDDEATAAPAPVIRVQAAAAKETATVSDDAKEASTACPASEKISTSEDNAASKRGQTSSLDLPSGSSLDEVNDKCLRRFFRKENRANHETLMMQFGMTPNEMDKLRKLADAVVAEWNLAGTTHENYKDWSMHLMNTMRIKQAEAGRKKTAVAENVAEPQQPASYDFGGGFGGQDV